MPATATDTKTFSKQSQKLSVQSKNLFESALSGGGAGNKNFTIAGLPEILIHSAPSLNNSGSPRRSLADEENDDTRHKKHSDGSHLSTRRVSFINGDDSGRSVESTSRKNSLAHSGGGDTSG